MNIGLILLSWVISIVLIIMFLMASGVFVVHIEIEGKDQKRTDDKADKDLPSGEDDN